MSVEHVSKGSQRLKREGKEDAVSQVQVAEVRINGTFEKKKGGGENWEVQRLKLRKPKQSCYANGDNECGYRTEPADQKLAERE